MTTIPTIRLRRADHRAIALEVVALLSMQAPANPDPWLTRIACARYLGVSARSFARLVGQYPKELAAVSAHPLRWSKSQLDRFAFSRRTATGKERRSA
jgi:hypothetical protein